MYPLLKLICVLIYALAIIHFFIIIPFGAWLQWLSLALLVSHLAEMVLFYKHIKKHPGPLSESLMLTLFYGLLHWLPLAKSSNTRTGIQL